MFKLSCDNCSGELTLDSQRTTADYLETMKYEVIHKGSLVNENVPLYMYYVCIKCNSGCKLTPVEFEGKIREHMAYTALKIKRANIMEQIDPHKIDPDNGMEYCGECIGYDSHGSCLVDIIKQCPLLREKKKNEELLTRRP